MTGVVDMLEAPKSTKDLTKQHFEFLAYVVKDNSVDRVSYPPVNYKVPPLLILELRAADLIYEDKNIKGLYRPTEKTIFLFDNFPTFHNLRRQDIVFEEINTKTAKAARRKGD